jgi:hypothetical protein
MVNIEQSNEPRQQSADLIAGLPSTTIVRVTSLLFMDGKHNGG